MIWRRWACRGFSVVLIACGIWITEEALAESDGGVVQTESGAIAGTIKPQGVRIFKGIPYAAPPIGNLRWRPPQHATAWTGVRKAITFSESCPQVPLPSGSIFYDGPYKSSEDCLYLNVWTSARSAKERRPVLLFLHHGSFLFGAGSRPMYDGESLSAKGLVVVTINYRLGILGQLAHPELSRESPHGVSGNYGLLDMVAAIKWTRRNIDAFGGDPNRITLYGESAGAIAASALATSPMIRGDIAGVIVGDGLFFAGAKLKDAEALGVGFAQAAGAASIQELRNRPAEDLLAAYEKYSGRFGVLIDHWVLSEDIFAAEKDGAHCCVPILTGSTADFYTALRNPISEKEYVAESTQKYGALAKRYLVLYPGTSDTEASASRRASGSDMWAWLHDRWASIQTQHGRRAYLYLFTHASPVPAQARTTSDGGPLPEYLGAYHTSEIPYAFNSLANIDCPWSAADSRLADLMSSYWVNFATNGDPNGPGLPRWPTYSDLEKPVMELGDQIRTISRVLSKPKAEFWADKFALQK